MSKPDKMPTPCRFLAKRYKAGDLAGSINAKGYVAMTVDGHRHFAHRLAWFYCFEKWPEGDLQIDHINGIKDVYHHHAYAGR